MKNHDFAKIFIFILLNSSVYTQEIKQTDFPEIQSTFPEIQSTFPEIQSTFPEIQSTFPEIQSINSPSIQVQNSDTNIRLSKANKVTEVRSDTVSNTELYLELLVLTLQLIADIMDLLS